MAKLCPTHLSLIINPAYCILFKSQFSSVAQSYPTLCDPMNCSTSGFLVLHHLLEFAQTHALWISDAIQPSHPLLPSSPPALNLSQHPSLFKWVGSSYQVANYWSFSFSINPSNEYLGLISFRIDWFDLLTVQGTLKSLLQHHSSKTSILQCSAFFMAQFSHLHITTGKNHSFGMAGLGVYFKAIQSNLTLSVYRHN